MVAGQSVRARRGLLAAVVLLGMLLAGLVLVSAAFAAPAGHFMPIAQRNDVCFDSQRNLLYITSGSEVLRYDLGTQTYLTPIDLGGNLAGMDISPDGSTLAVADTDYSGDLYSSGTDDDYNWVYLVDLDSGFYDEIDSPRGAGEEGTWMVAWDADGRLLSTSQTALYWPGSLRRYDPDTDDTTVLGSVAGETALSASGDRQSIAIAQGSTSATWGVYHDSDGSIQWSTFSGGYASDIAANKDGSQFSLPLSTDHIFDGSLAQTATLATPTGARYSPDSDLLFLPIGNQNVVNAYDSKSFQLVDSFDCSPTTFGPYQLGWTTATWFAWPRLSVGSQGEFMAVTVANGVEYFDSRSSVHGSVRSSNGGGPVPTAMVQVWRQHASAWSIENTLTVNQYGGWSYETTDSAPLRFRVFDPSGGHASGWYGGISLQTATSAVATTGASPSLDVTLPFLTGGTLGGIVMDAVNGYGIGSEKVTAWPTETTGSPKLVTTTAADGVYHFTDLPPGDYFVRFDDPTFTWHHQFYAGADTSDTSEPVFVSGPGSFNASAQLSRHTAELELSTTTPAPGSQLVAETGGTISIQTTCTDAGADDAPRNGMAVVLQSSADGSLWTTETVPVAQAGDGVYRATISASSVATRYYRFAVPSATYIDGTLSLPVVVHFYGPSRWSSDAQIAPGYPTGVKVGQATGVTCQLIRFDGTPASGRKVVLQASLYGAWWTSTAPVAGGPNGYYTAIFSPVQGMSYRLTTVGTAAEPSVASGGISMLMNAPNNGWSDFGGGRIGSVNSSADFGTPTHLDGYSANFLGSAESVSVYSSPDGVNYTRTTIPVSNAGLVLRNGAITAHYVANVSSVVDLRYYAFVMQGTGGGEPSVPAPSYPVYVNPTPLYTLNAVKGIKAGQAITVSGVVKPHMPAGARAVTITVHRNGTSNKLVYNAAVFDKGAFSGFSQKVKLSTRGTYLVQVFINNGGATDGGPYGGVPAWGGSQHLLTRKVVVR